MPLASWDDVFAQSTAPPGSFLRPQQPAPQPANAATFGAIPTDKPTTAHADTPSGKQPADAETDRLKAISDRQTHAFEGFGKDMPKFPGFTPPPPPPQPQETDPVTAWGSLAMLAASLGGFRSRNHATAAVNAAAEALKGIHQKDTEAYQHAMDKWKIESENAARIQNYELDAYKAVMDQKQFDLSKWMQLSNMEQREKMVELRAVAIDLQNERAKAQLEERRMEDFFKDRIATQKVLDQEEKQRLHIDGLNTMQRAWQSENYPGGVPRQDGQPLMTFPDWLWQRDPGMAEQSKFPKPKDPNAPVAPANAPATKEAGPPGILGSIFGGGAKAGQPKWQTKKEDGSIWYSQDGTHWYPAPTPAEPGPEPP